MEEFEQIDILLVEDKPIGCRADPALPEREKLANQVTWVKDGADALDYSSAAVRTQIAAITLPRLILARSEDAAGGRHRKCLKEIKADERPSASRWS